MKKYLISAVIVLLSLSANAATSGTFFIAANCSITGNDIAKGFCDGTYSACSSAGGDLARQLGKSTYANCGRIYSEGLNGYAVVCFEANSYTSDVVNLLCQWFKGGGGCGDAYIGTTPAGVSFSGNAIGNTVTIYPYQIECCQTCSGYTYTSLLSGAVEKRARNTCSTDGTCAGSTTNAHVSYYCAPKYYSTSGTASVSGSGDPRSLNCKECSALDTSVTIDDVNSPERSTSPTDCYIPADHELTDDLGTYIYESNCHYSS